MFVEVMVDIDVIEDLVVVGVVVVEVLVDVEVVVEVDEDVAVELLVVAVVVVGVVEGGIGELDGIVGSIIVDEMVGKSSNGGMSSELSDSGMVGSTTTVVNSSN